jgi:predicted lipid-binding transport protein (Tim44 family)
MKRFFSIFALMFVMAFSAPDAMAKKFGGGKSFGKSYKTAPAPKAQPTNTSTLNKQNTPTSGSSKKGLMGGILGGLLAGGLLAALFGSGAFEGFQFMDFIIIAIAAFALFKLFKWLASRKHAVHSPNSAAYAGGNKPAQKGYYHEEQTNNAAFRETSNFAGSQSQLGGGFGITDPDVPFNFVPGFDAGVFVNGAREHYRILQEAWNYNQLEKIQEYVTAELYNDLVAERRALAGDQHTEVMFVDAEIVRADCTSHLAEISLKFSGRYRDTKEGVEEAITDIWHLERNLTTPNAPWLIVGIEA